MTLGLSSDDESVHKLSFTQAAAAPAAPSSTQSLALNCQQCRDARVSSKQLWLAVSALVRQAKGRATSRAQCPNGGAAADMLLRFGERVVAPWHDSVLIV